jgi:hypothetical protein
MTNRRPATASDRNRTRDEHPFGNHFADWELDRFFQSTWPAGMTIARRLANRIRGDMS